jgi:ERCC4-related helicase
MRGHYWPAKTAGSHIPHILGLTASPVMRATDKDLHDLEQRLDSLCVSPKTYRDDLMKYVNQPEVIVVNYPTPLDQLPIYEYTPTMLSLHEAYQRLDISKDPGIIRLEAEKTDISREKLQEALTKKNTYVQKRMKTLRRGSIEMYQQLGPWAADYFISTAITDFLDKNSRMTPTGLDIEDTEAQYLCKVLQSIQLPSSLPDMTNISTKLRELVTRLQHDTDDGEPIRGIIFVRERITVALLTYFLSNHAELREKYKVGSIVGSSKAGKKQDFDLSRPEDLDSLVRFHNGHLQLLVGTNVVEEGIDIQACNLVISFDRPANIKSFVQCRGRARLSVSRFIVLADDKSVNLVNGWQDQEKLMKEKYENKQRERQQRIEESERTDESLIQPLVIAASGACLRPSSAKSHLQHFCTTLSTGRFVDTTPYYVIRNDETGRPGQLDELSSKVRATVYLPLCLAPELRQATSSEAWLSKQTASKDAALQAYIALYKAGLIDDHLQPKKQPFQHVRDFETKPSIIQAKEQLDPWYKIANAWRSQPTIYRSRLSLMSPDESAKIEVDLELPVPIPNLGRLKLHWDTDSVWTVDMSPSSERAQAGARITQSQDNTTHLLSLAYGHRWRVEDKEHLARFISGQNLLSSTPAAIETEEALGELKSKLEKHQLIRDAANSNYPYLFSEWLPTKPAKELVRHPDSQFDDAPEDIPYVAVNRWPKKAGYFQRPRTGSRQPNIKPYYRVLPAHHVATDEVAAEHSHFGMLIPSILHSLEVHLVATELFTETDLATLGLRDLSLVTTAICTPAAREPVDYQRLEFLGDSILKLCVTANLLVKCRQDSL